MVATVGPMNDQPAVIRTVLDYCGLQCLRSAGNSALLSWAVAAHGTATSVLLHRRTMSGTRTQTAI